uniref:Uncharacterized protein n=1 Tax=Alexandrium catenella TaxID=2925 RepID=A0A7S1WFS0_ALECA|mmetsp:Transcript_57333/g.153554  ORF Transcript_57333/g.153554 Transcript_57333/m.153554 type:complete len:505 (+) Transcript_57333:20-1534(+)
MAAVAAAAGPWAGGGPGVPESGFEDLVSLAKSALPDMSKDKDGKIAEMVGLYRGYLRDVTPERREAPVLAVARHALRNARESGRPSLGGYACKTVIGTLLPKLIELCHPDMPDYEAVLTPCHDNGLFANVLQVFDALLLSGPNAKVLVDWRRKGEEGHFQYGPAEFDLWAHLFRTSERIHSVADCKGATAPDNTIALKSRASVVFLNMLRGYVWTFPELPALRGAYASACRCLQPSPEIAARVDEVCASWGPGACVVAVHKRLGTSEVAACQLSQRNPGAEEYIARARKVATAASAVNGQRPVVFLATDDVHAAEAFRKAFPEDGGIQLCLRSGVKRSQGGVREDGVDNEVHRNPCEVTDAEDALIDALCLSRCQDLVCIDSNVSIFAALTNPDLRLHPLNTILPEGWEEAADHPAETVHAAYRVAYKPMVFVRGGPSAATELLGARKHGEIVHTTRRGFDGWVELREGGWMLADGERQAQSRGQGNLLEPVEAGEAADAGLGH